MMALREPAKLKGTLRDRDDATGDKADRLLVNLLEHLEKNDADGARAGLQSWLNVNKWQGGHNQELASLAFLLIEKVAELVAQRLEPFAAREFCLPSEPVDAAFATSTHFSLLTAAIMRQREQIRQIMALVENLSRRLA